MKDRLERAVDLSEAIHRDITLADAKAVFAISITTLGIASALSTLGDLDGGDRVRVLSSPILASPLVVGAIFAAFALLASVVTVMPRRYVVVDERGVADKADLARDLRATLRLPSWVRVPRWVVGRATARTKRILERMLRPGADGASDLLDAAARALAAEPDADKFAAPLIREVARLAVVRRRKYWWVGRAVGLALISGFWLTIGIVVALRSSPGTTNGAAVTKTAVVRQINSGGQTGADRAALDFALKSGIRHGGFVQKGRTDEDEARIPDMYANLREAPHTDPAVRTVLNVAASYGTVVLSHGPLEEGSGEKLTADVATLLERPLLLLPLDPKTLTITQAAKTLRTFLEDEQIAILNVAGPRASKDPKIYDDTLQVLQLAFEGLEK